MPFYALLLVMPGVFFHATYSVAVQIEPVLIKLKYYCCIERVFTTHLFISETLGSLIILTTETEKSENPNSLGKQ